MCVCCLVRSVCFPWCASVGVCSVQVFCFYICGFFFFFQAEDGIRDLVRSRGLGDVYKRQALDALVSCLKIRLREVVREDMSGTYGVRVAGSFPVSYTHLTLPTSDLV